MTNANETVIADNYVHDTYGGDIGARNCTGSIISGNVCDTTSIHNSISLVTVTNSLIENNVCLNSGVYGLTLEYLSVGACTGVAVVGNPLSACSRSGIRVYARYSGVDSADYCIFETI